MLAGRVFIWTFIGLSAIFAAGAMAQEATPPPRTPATTTAMSKGGPPAAAQPVPAAQAPTQPRGLVPASPEPSGPDYRKLFRPVFQTPVLVWFGGLLWVMLAIDFRRFWSLRTIDVTAIVLLSVLLQFRHDDRTVTLANAHVSYAFVAWTGVFAVCAYLFLRTLGQLLRRAARETPGHGVGAGAWVLLAFVLSTTLCSLPVTSVGDAGVRLTRGGEYLRDTGMLPYGKVGPGEMAGPLLYVIDAAILKPATNPPSTIDASPGEKTTRAVPASESPNAASPHLKAVRWLAGVGQLLLLLGIIVLGAQLHSVRTGALLAALYGILAPVAPSLGMPNMTVPAALVVWALIAASPKARTLGAAASGVLLAAAWGVMLYPALLAPAWFGYFLRRRPAGAAIGGAQAPVPATEPGVGDVRKAAPPRRRRDFGALAFAVTFVLVAGSIKWYALQKTAPMPPRTDGVLAAMGESTAAGAYELSVTGNRWKLAPVPGATSREAPRTECLGFRALRWMADDGSTGNEPRLSQELLGRIAKSGWEQGGLTPPSATALPPEHQGLPLREIRPIDAEAARALLVMYQQAAADYSWWRRSIASGRTIFESVFPRELGLFGGTPSVSERLDSRPAVAGCGDCDSAWAQWERQRGNQIAGDEASAYARSEARTRIREIEKAHRYVLAAHLALCLLLFLVMIAFKSRCTLWHLCAASAAVLAGMELWRMDGDGAAVAWYLPLAVVALFAGCLPHTPVTAPQGTPPPAPAEEPTPYAFSKASAG